MHELPVTQNILEICLRYAQQAHASRIVDIYLVIGEYASILDDSVQFYWDMIAKGTIAEGAVLHFERIPAEFTCQSCAHTYKPSEADFTCPKCHATSVKIVHGNEFRVDSLNIE